ncbi:hypothetical protein IMZ48_10815 [Candidatus Bathyarchaeota archaeon]|nr:hypothetical protein [Candidatus Bathyarchaeota archaeon]
MVLYRIRRRDGRVAVVGKRRSRNGPPRERLASALRNAGRLTRDSGGDRDEGRAAGVAPHFPVHPQKVALGGREVFSGALLPVSLANNADHVVGALQQQSLHGRRRLDLRRKLDLRRRLDRRGAFTFLPFPG